MYNLKLIIPFLIFILSSCTQTFEKNGLSEKKIENFDIKIGKTSKKFLIDNYGPPIFENVFNDNVIYYVSHSTSYKTFDDRKTDKLFVFEITLDDKNVVKKYKKYSDKDSLDIKVVKNNDNKDIDLTSFWKDIVRALRRTNNED
jgi:outer membrane protein assembly factor BamE (lipoprotein component of BamABCDE complex)